MNIHTDTSLGRGNPPLTRSDVEERLQEVGSSEKLELVGENLRGIDLSRLSLRRTNFEGANLSRAILIEADLEGANLVGANFREASLDRANFKGANFIRANLIRANLIRVDLRGASFNEAYLSEAYLSGADLEGANLVGADLEGANLVGADLEEADLREANLRGVDLRGTNLRGVDLRGVDLMVADLREADLRGANLVGADLVGANLRGADLRGADLVGANLRGTNLRGTNLEGTTLGGTHQTSKKKDKRRETAPALHLRIQEEPLTASRLRASLDALTSLYVKAWLLQQGRFDDFVLYTEHKDRRFEEEANLLIAELKYNSPADIKFTFDLSPKAFIEALQMLIDTITLVKLRKQAKEEENRSQALDNQLKEEKIREERLKNVDHMIEIAKRATEVVELIRPGLDTDNKGIAVQSFMEDMVRLASDHTLEISLHLSPTLPKPLQNQSTLQETESNVQAAKKMV